MRVAIVGAGTAGSAAALFLARDGHDVTVFEKVEDPHAVGAGILLQPTGMRVLAELGLLEPVLARGARVDRLLATNARGAPVLDVAYSRHDPALFGLGLHRGVLFSALFSAVRARGIPVRTGLSIEQLSRDGGTTALLDEHGGRHGPFELVVIADGARSRLREAAGLRSEAPEYPWGALWFVAEDPGGLVRGVLRQFLDGPRTMLGFLPTGLGPDGATPLVSVFWSERVDRMEELRRGDLPAFRARVEAMAPAQAPLLDALGSLQELIPASYRDVRMPRWHGEGVVAIGDAAHATSPQLGQGCTLALVDAWVLARCVASEPSLAAALVRYDRERRAHLGYYQRASRWLTPLFQSDHGWLGPLRDIGMRLASALPYTSTQMVATMAGVKTGFVFGRLSLPGGNAPALPPAEAKALPDGAHDAGPSTAA